MKYALACLTLALASCASSPSPRVLHPQPFDVSAHAVYQYEGSSSLVGTASYQDELGRVYSCANQQVHLLPKTPYFDHLIEGDRQGLSLASAIDPRADSLVRSATCNDAGTFVFHHLPAASWYLVAPSERAIALTHVVTREGEFDDAHVRHSDAEYLSRSFVHPRPSAQRTRLNVSGGECDQHKAPKWCGRVVAPVEGDK